MSYLPEHADLYEWIEQWSDTTLSGRSEGRAIALMGSLEGMQEVQLNNGPRFNDRLLAHVGGKLQGELPPAARCFNWHDKRILIIIPDPPPDVIDESILDRLTQVAEGPHDFAGKAFRLQSAFGVSRLPQAGDNFDDLIMAAQRALRRANDSNQAYVRSKTNTQSQGSVLLNELNQALQEEQFFLKYQPQFDRSLRCSGAEALIRWEHPERGEISPGEFLPLAERSGLIHFISNWVFEAGFEQIAAWQDSSFWDDRCLVALNVSPSQLTSKHFPTFLKEQKDRTGVNPAGVEIEVTEKALDSSPEVIIERLTALREQGYSIALDDFGTGYSSVQRLADFPLDRVKIDRSLLPTAKSDRRRFEIIRFLIQIADVLDLDILVEGIETDQQLDLLQQTDCDAMQGFYFEHPVAHDKLQANYLRGDKPVEVSS